MKECNLGGDNTKCGDCAYYPDYEWNNDDEECMRKWKNESKK